MPNLNKKTIGGAILGVLVLLLFFSKTIYAHNLPEVSAVLPKNGRLSKQERTTGVASWAETEKLYAELDGTVEEVLVQEGDKVRKGQELLRLGFDRDDAERKLRELQNQRSGLYLDIQEINLRLNKAQRQKEDLAGEEIEEEEITDYDLTKLNMDIRVARLELQEAREQHDYGDISDADLERARLKLQGLYVDLEKLEHELEEKEKQAKKDLEKDEKEKDSGLKDSDDSIASANLELKAKNLALEKVALDEEPLKKALEDFETYAVITAPADGTITTLDVSKGETVRDAQLLLGMGVGDDFYIDCPVPLENSFIKAGDECELGNASLKIKGAVGKVTPTEQGKTVRVKVSSDEITAGETFDVLFKKESDTSYILVPNGALNKDKDGYFLQQIKRRDGIMGPEYYLDRLGVFIGDSDSENTAVVQGISFFEPVVLLSDKPVKKGDTILLNNEGDFFES